MPLAKHILLFVLALQCAGGLFAAAEGANREAGFSDHRGSSGGAAGFLNCPSIGPDRCL